MKNFFKIASITAWLSACGTLSSISHIAGRANVDAVTASLRDAFSNAIIPAQSDINKTTSHNGWHCFFHATTNDIVERGVSEFDFHATFTIAGILLRESVDNVISGDLAFAPWSKSFAVTNTGLRSDGHYFSEVVRFDHEDNLLSEWSYLAAPGDERGDDSFGAAGMKTAGYSICTPLVAH